MDAQHVIQTAMDFSMDLVIAKYSEKYNVPMVVAKEHEMELKRYLALCALNPARVLGMAGPVDDLWHTFICFTKEYAKFCQQIAGRFIHHAPTTVAKRKNGEGQNEYATFVNAYQERFGELPKHIWPIPSPTGLFTSSCDGCGSCSAPQLEMQNSAHGMSCDSCNGCGCSSCQAGLEPLNA